MMISIRAGYIQKLVSGVVLTITVIFNMLTTVCAVEDSDITVNVSSTSITDTSESRTLKSLTGEQNARVKVGVTRTDSNSNISGSVTLVITLFQDANLLKAVRTSQQTLGVGGSQTVTADFDLTQYNDVNDKWYFKVLILKSFDSMKPLTESILLPGSPFWWGICGHTAKYTAYPLESMNAQLDNVKALGCNIYRIDSVVEGNYPNYTFDKMGQVLSAAKSKGLSIFMVFQPSLGAEPNQLRESAKDAAAYFNKYYPGVIKYYQLGNENDAKCITSSDVDGSSAGHYSDPNYTAVLERMQGLKDGFADAGITGKPGDPKLVVNFCYLHTGFLDRLKASNFQYDVIGYDWYSSAKYRADTLKYLADTFNKEIIITEDNIKDGTLSSSQTAQSNYIRQQALYAYYSGNSKLIGYIPYELLDEYNYGSANGESNYGLIQASASGIGAWKSAAYTYRDTIKEIKESKTIFADYFDDQIPYSGSPPNGWTISPSSSGGAYNVKVGTKSNNEDLAMRLQDNDAGGYVSAERSFSAQSGVVTASWRFNEDQNLTSTSTNFILKSGSINAVELFTSYDGTTKKLKYRNAAGNAADICTLTKNKWYAVTVKANTDTDTFDIYVDRDDDYSTASDFVSTIKVNSAPLEFRTAVTSMDRINFSTTLDATTLYTWIDNIRVTKSQ